MLLCSILLQLCKTPIKYKLRINERTKKKDKPNVYRQQDCNEWTVSWIICETVIVSTYDDYKTARQPPRLITCGKWQYFLIYDKLWTKDVPCLVSYGTVLPHLFNIVWVGLVKLQFVLQSLYLCNISFLVKWNWGKNKDSVIVSWEILLSYFMIALKLQR